MPDSTLSIEERQAALDAERDRIERMFAALENKIKRVRPPILYRIQLLLTALVMMMLPLVYLAMIVAVAGGVYYHATVNAAILKSDEDFRLLIVEYLGPILAGVFIIGALVKPLLARPSGGISPRPLKREEEPLLFEFVDRLCQCVRAPKPTRIQVDCKVNASASPRRGLLSLLAGNLTLTIGLPLVQGMNLRQFTGVLAHEFGHFGQGGAMTLHFMIHRINYWFAQVVDGRDTWDAGLDVLARRFGIFGMFVALAAGLCIWIARKFLFVLMLFAHFISCGLSRQMEYDADRYQARVAGGEEFEKSMQRVILLSGAWQLTEGDLTRSWEEKRLGDQLPALVEYNCEHLTDDQRADFLKQGMEAKTRMFSTHPSPATRVRRAAREKGEGILTDEGPASILFRKYTALCKTATMDFYAGVLGPRLAQAKLVPTEELIRRREALEAEQAVAKRFSNGVLLFPQMVVPETNEMEPPADPKAALLELQKQRKMTGIYAMPMDEAIKRYGEARRMHAEACVAECLIDASLRFRPAEYGLAKRDRDEARRRAEKAARVKEDSLIEVHPVVYSMRRRILCAMQLLYMPQVCERLADAGRMKRDAEELVRALRTMESIEPSAQKLRGSLNALATLLKNLKGRHRNRKFVNQVMLQAKRAQEEMARIREIFHWVDYPFEHGSEKINLGEYLVPAIPNRKEIGAVLNRGAEALDRCERFFYRATGAVIKIAEQVETALGLDEAPANAAPEPELPAKRETAPIVEATAKPEPEQEEVSEATLNRQSVATVVRPKYQPLRTLNK